MEEQLQKEQDTHQQQEWHPTWSNLGLGMLGGFTAFGLEGAHSPGLALFVAALSVGATRYGDDVINGVGSLFSAQGRAELATKFSRKPQPKEDGNVTRILPESITYASFDDDDDEDISLASKAQKKDGIFRFSELLASGFVPTINKIFVGRTMDGKDIFVSAKDLCHVALAGKTGGGKGSLMRLLMVQLCYVGAKVLLLNPHYMKWVVADAGKEFDEDWTPWEGINPRKSKPYLEQPPMNYAANYPSIGEALEWVVRTLLNDRMVQGGEGGKRFAPYFIVLDEWPAVVDELKDAPKRLSKLLREGRKYGIFVIVASQDFQVKTIGMDGGSVRKCLLTAFYTGGDKTTCKELLNYEKMEDIPENKLGKGIVVLRCVGTQNEPTLVRVPFVDNQSVYQLLGPSTFKKAVTTQKKEVEIVEPQLDWTAGDDEPHTQPTKQEITLTYEQLLAIQGMGSVRNTDDLPEDTQVIHSPYYEQTAQHLYYRPELEERRIDQIPTQVQQSVQKLSPAKTTLEQRAALKVGEGYRYWSAGHNSVRKLQKASKWSDGFTRAVIKAMVNQGLIERQW